MGSVGVPFPITEGVDAEWGYERSFEGMRRIMDDAAYSKELVNDFGQCGHWSQIEHAGTFDALPFHVLTADQRRGRRDAQSNLVRHRRVAALVPHRGTSVVRRLWHRDSCGGWPTPPITRREEVPVPVVTIHPTGEVIYLEPGETVLSGLYKAGFAYTVGCRRGGCAICKVDCRSGQFSYDHRVADTVLTAAELLDGTCLSCRAVPDTDISIELRGEHLRLVSTFLHQINDKARLRAEAHSAAPRKVGTTHKEQQWES